MLLFASICCSLVQVLLGVTFQSLPRQSSPPRMEPPLPGQSPPPQMEAFGLVTSVALQDWTVGRISQASGVSPGREAHTPLSGAAWGSEGRRWLQMSR